MSWTKAALICTAAVATGVIGVGWAGGPGTPVNPAPAGQPTRAERPSPQADDHRLAAAKRAADAEVAAQLEAEIAKRLHEAAPARVERKLHVAAAEQRLQSVLDGIRYFENFKDVAGYEMAVQIDAKMADEFFKSDQLKPVVELLAKARLRAAELRQALLHAQEELNVFDQLAALRIEALKRQYGQR